MSASNDLVSLNYRDIRSQIEDGDIVLFRSSIFLSRIIETVSHGPYSHCAIAANWGERKMLLQAEMMAGIQAIPMSIAITIQGSLIEWYKIERSVRPKIDIPELLLEARADLGRSYATSELLREAANGLLGAKLPADCDNPNALFSSQYVERCFRKAGISLCKNSDVGSSPSEIASSDVLQFMGNVSYDPTRSVDRIT